MLEMFYPRRYEVSAYVIPYDHYHANGIRGVMTDYEEKFHNLGTKINRCVGTKETMDPEPEYLPVPGPDARAALGSSEEEPSEG